MKYQNLEHLLSPPRLSRYLIACSNSKSRAQKLYRANLRIAQAFYPVLNLFEVILRNRIHEKLTNHFRNSNWIIDEKTGFMNDRTLRRSRFYIKSQVIKAEQRLTRRGRAITTGKIIAEQTFGFWTSLYERHHYGLVGGVIIRCFPNKPSFVNRSSIQVKLQMIRDFRNRIYHNEPICFSGSSVGFQDAEQVREALYDLLEWISIEAKSYVEEFDNIDNKIESGKRI